jgi:hypothetical protein
MEAWKQFVEWCEEYRRAKVALLREMPWEVKMLEEGLLGERLTLPVAQMQDIMWARR